MSIHYYNFCIVVITNVKRNVFGVWLVDKIKYSMVIFLNSQ